MAGGREVLTEYDAAVETPALSRASMRPTAPDAILSANRNVSRVLSSQFETCQD
jgi:hypothetical protein